MNTHLTQDQILEWICGERPETWAAHLHSCAQCAAHAEEVSEPLRGFRDTVSHLVSERGSTAVRPPARWPAFYWPAAISAAALLLFAVAPRRPAAVPAPVSAAAAAVSDDTLLERIDWEVSASVPAPMRPLAALMSNDTSLSGAGRSQ